jgi:hypothetical protein
MSLMYDLLKAGGCSIVAFGGSGLGTSPVTPTDYDGNPIAYECKGLRLFNPNADKTLYYSFDNSNWLTVPPLGVMEDPKNFSVLYVKSSGSSSNYEGDVARVQ